MIPCLLRNQPVKAGNGAGVAALGGLHQKTTSPAWEYAG